MVEKNITEKSSKHTYTYIYKISAGSFGEIWYAEDETKAPVVIKVYKNTIKDSSIQTEINNLKYIKSLCQDYSICYIDDYIINKQRRLVMNYINGVDLFELLKIYPLHQKETSSKIIYDLILGINKFHSIGIAHQDIKLENVMYNGNFIYVDWGLSCLKSLCNNTYTDICDKPCGILGTLDLTSPEKLSYYKSTNIIYANTRFMDNILHDIWSLGILLLEWFSGYTVTSKNYFMYLNKYLQNTKGNKLAKCILPLLLEQNKYKRAFNWKVVVNVVNLHKMVC
jgi:serine/threonine protein kinase